MGMGGKEVYIPVSKKYCIVPKIYFVMYKLTLISFTKGYIKL